MSILKSLPNLNVLPHSVVVAADGESELGLVRFGAELKLAILAKRADSPAFDGFEGERSTRTGYTLLLGPTSARNAHGLRNHLPWLKPRPLGLQTSVGMGDRLGLATPGHVRAVRAVGGKVEPIFCQQSIREMTRTRRTPQQVMDDATWGMFQEGWRGGAGADADHLKTTEDIDSCLAAGFTFFTIDPGEHVDNSAESASPSELLEKLGSLPWKLLDDKPSWLTSRYVGPSFDVEEHTITFDEHTLVKAAVKYGQAVAHVAEMYRHLIKATNGWNCELEVSVDETEQPTSPTEHLYIAKELRRLGVHWVSLAPRYVGRFEKGVDYIGNLAKFEASFAVHAAIARELGPYKLSLHSGSDKFSVYPIALRQTHGLVHLKTAGTSYLEALHTIAQIDPAFFRSIYVFARERYETDKVSYHVSAELARAPEPRDVQDKDLPRLLDQFDAREIFHVTFGSVLTMRGTDGRLRFYDQFMEFLRRNPEAYAANLEAHFVKHLKPFVSLP